MQITHHASAPPTADRYERRLLTLSTRVAHQTAGSALRAWWLRQPDAMRPLHGLVIDRSDIVARNNDAGGKPAPVVVFSSTARRDEEVLFAAFPDASAVILRGTGPARAGGPAAFDSFRVVPGVFRLTSILRPTDGRPATRIRMRGGGSRRHTMVTLEAESNPDGWVNLAAESVPPHGHIDDDLRAEIRDAVLGEAAAWSDALAALPLLHAAGNGEPRSGDLPDAERPLIGLDPADSAGSAATVSCPAFQPWRAYSLEKREEMMAFLRQVCVWMLDQCPEEISQIEASVATRQPRQNSGSGAPVPRIIAEAVPFDPYLQERVGERLTRCLDAILAADIAPIRHGDLTGQVLRDFRNQRTWLEADDIGTVFANRKQASRLSAHERLRLHARFDRFRDAAS